LASGGLRTGLEIAKCIALGAVLGGMASPFLEAAAHSIDETIQIIEQMKREIQITMFATGASRLQELRNKLIDIS